MRICAPKPNVAFVGHLTGSPLEHHVQSQLFYQAADTPSCVLASFVEHSKHQSKHLQHCQLFLVPAKCTNFGFLTDQCSYSMYYTVAPSTKKRQAKHCCRNAKQCHHVLPKKCSHKPCTAYVDCSTGFHAEFHLLVLSCPLVGLEV